MDGLNFMHNRFEYGSFGFGTGLDFKTRENGPRTNYTVESNNIKGVPHNVGDFSVINHLGVIMIYLKLIKLM